MVLFLQAIESNDSKKWINARNDELKSMKQNEVLDVFKFFEGFKTVRCNWVFKTKRNHNDNIKWHKARLAIKGFTQKKGINYK